MDARKVFQSIRKNVPFIRGITVSGGECMLHPDFLLELFTLVKGIGLSALIDSNGMVDFKKYPQLTHLCDGVMLDVKSWDPAPFLALTGSGNDIVKSNLKYLAEENRLAEIRIVCLDGWTDPEAVIRGVAEALTGKTARQTLKLIRFRNFGVRGSLQSVPSPSEEKMQKLFQFAQNAGFQNIMIT